MENRAARRRGGDFGDAGRGVGCPVRRCRDPCQSGTDSRASELIETARASLAAGDRDGAAATLRRLRLHYPESPLVAEALLLSATVAAARNDAYQERFFLAETRRAVRRLADRGLLSATAAIDYHLQTTSRLAQLLETERDYAGALRNYEEAIALLAARLSSRHDSLIDPRAAPGQAQRLAQLRLAAAHLAYRHGVGIGGDAERHFDQVDVAELGTEAVPRYRELARGLMWGHLTPRQLGMGDGNMSAIATDGDDVWVGSWTGGLVVIPDPRVGVRYSARGPTRCSRSEYVTSTR